MKEEYRKKLSERCRLHPLREKPVGFERLWKDGYVRIKISNLPFKNKDLNWRLKHVWLYEQAHNVTVDRKKEVVIFLDQNKSNFDIKNLYLLTRAELAVLNRNYKLTDNPEENLAYIALAKAKIAAVELADKVGLTYRGKKGKVIRSLALRRSAECNRRKRLREKNKKQV